MQGPARRHLLPIAAALLLVLACALIVPGLAFARAGGGHVGGSFHSSGGGYGGPGVGGTSFLGDPGTWFTFLLIVGNVMWLVAYFLKKRTQKIESEKLATLKLGAEASMGTIKAEDPAFSEQDLDRRVAEMFVAIQEAWTRRDMEPARRFLSPEQFQILSTGVAEYVSNGQINLIGDPTVDRIVPILVTREGGFDFVKLMLTATMLDYTIDERSGEIVNPLVLGDGKTPRTFDEYWTLTRKVGAHTKADATISKCPHCGAPVTDGNYIKCAYCGTMMNDPALDWVLLRIEQP